MPGADRVAFDALFEDVRKVLRDERPRDERLLSVCELMKKRVPHYDWVGFYLREPPLVGARHAVPADTVPVLVLGPYAGEPTEHTRIAFGRGICGQAAERKETFVAPDVSKETGYLSCSAKVKSEIVVPILKHGEVAGEIDVDSHTIDPFGDGDRAFLERVASEVANVL